MAGVTGLAARDVTKSYGATRALRGASLDAERGRITALVGQNGAGKSTLMGILAGAVMPDAGRITLDGASYAPKSPLEARHAGVVMVHQELSLCLHVSVAENVFLGEIPTRRGLVDWAFMRRRAEEALEPLAGAGTIDVRARVRDLSPANQQIVEIARALTATTKCRVLILDEPTSSLGGRDVERLFSRLRVLRDAGLVILYLSHFLEEVQAIADRYVVVRDGETVGAGEVASTSIDALVTLMAGHAATAVEKHTNRSVGGVALSVTFGSGVKLEVRRGEIVGITGLIGSGRTELLRAIHGLCRPPPGMTLDVKGRVAMVSEDRKAEGLAVSLSIAENVTMSRPASWFVTRPRDERATAPWLAKLGVRAKGASQKVGELSGGNQQKVAIARVLHDGADVLLVDEPTRGIDVEAKAQIYALLEDAAGEGKAVLVVSSYIPELLRVCDRVHVMRRGVLGGAHAVRETDEHALLREASA